MSLSCILYQFSVNCHFFSVNPNLGFHGSKIKTAENCSERSSEQYCAKGKKNYQPIFRVVMNGD